MTDPHTPAGQPDCNELLTCLAQEQDALERLLFKLREQHLILTSGEHRWLEACTAEVEAAVRELTATGQHREAVADKVHTSYRLAAGSTLGALAERVDDELVCQQLHQRQRMLRDVLDQVRRASRQNRQLLAHGLAATNDALAVLGAVPTYDAGGAASHAVPRTRSFDTRV